MPQTLKSWVLISALIRVSSYLIPRSKGLDWAIAIGFLATGRKEERKEERKILNIKVSEYLVIGQSIKNHWATNSEQRNKSNKEIKSTEQNNWFLILKNSNIYKKKK